MKLSCELMSEFLAGVLNAVSLMPFDILIGLVPVVEVCLNILVAAEGNQVSPAVSPRAGEAGHSLTTLSFLLKRGCNRLVQPYSVLPWANGSTS